MSVNPFATTNSSSSTPPSSLGSAMRSFTSGFKSQQAQPAESNTLSLPTLFGSSVSSANSDSDSTSPYILAGVGLILAFLLYNLYQFYTKGIDAVTGFLQPLFQPFVLEKEQPATVTTTSTTNSQEQNIDTSLNTATPSVNQKTQESTVTPDDAMSSSVNGKSGFCFIGMQNGYRSCASVEESDICMSGEIFPSMDVCINPQLRY